MSARLADCADGAVIAEKSSCVSTTCVNNQVCVINEQQTEECLPTCTDAPIANGEACACNTGTNIFTSCAKNYCLGDADAKECLPECVPAEDNAQNANCACVDSENSALLCEAAQFCLDDGTVAFACHEVCKKYSCTSANDAVACTICKDEFADLTTDCVDCNAGYSKQGATEPKTCQPNTCGQNTTPENCALCTVKDGTECAVCDAGYKLDDNTKQCAGITCGQSVAAGCQFCATQDGNVCAVCNTGFLYPETGCVTAGQKCSSPINKCEYCTATDAAKCAKCDGNFAGNDCNVCKEGFKAPECTECIDGKTGADFSVTCSVTNCQTCPMNDGTTCTKCNSAELAPSVDGKTCVTNKCLIAITNCLQCENDDDCKTCKDSFQNPATKCVEMKCASTVSNCQHCTEPDGSQCKECATDYKLKDGKCSKGLSGGAIAGIVIAVLVVVAAICAGVYFFMKKKAATKNSVEEVPDNGSQGNNSDIEQEGEGRSGDDQEAVAAGFAAE